MENEEEKTGQMSWTEEVNGIGDAKRNILKQLRTQTSAAQLEQYANAYKTLSGITPRR